MIPLLLHPAHQRSAHRNRHHDHEHEAQFPLHAIAAASASQCLEYGLVHSNASLEIFQWKIFIRRMRPAILQRETDQQRFDAKNISKVGDNWNAPAFANEGRVLVEHFLQRSLRGLAEFTVRVGQIPRAMMTARRFQTHSRGQILLEMFLHETDNHVCLLIWDQAKGQLRHRVTRQDRFRSRSLITTADAVDFGGWTRPNPFESAEPCLAKKSGRARFLEHFGIRIERQFFPTVPFPTLQRRDVHATAMQKTGLP